MKRHDIQSNLEIITKEIEFLRDRWAGIIFCIRQLLRDFLEIRSTENYRLTKKAVNVVMFDNVKRTTKQTEINYPF